MKKTEDIWEGFLEEANSELVLSRRFRSQWVNKRTGLGWRGRLRRGEHSGRSLVGDVLLC